MCKVSEIDIFPALERDTVYGDQPTDHGRACTQYSVRDFIWARPPPAPSRRHVTDAFPLPPAAAALPAVLGIFLPASSSMSFRW
mmetsp:Transcript_10829/g.31766  ORF Transcript_10829/g.31766 Transcript_10829/m.31766 type:complete len:84 (-) Transcript_10829:1460-1711(-)